MPGHTYGSQMVVCARLSDRCLHRGNDQEGDGKTNSFTRTQNASSIRGGRFNALLRRIAYRFDFHTAR